MSISVLRVPAGEPGRDLLEQPAVAVRIVERGIREMGATFGIQPRKELFPLAVEQLADLDPAADKVLARRLVSETTSSNR
jgi:hypothetical protein